MVKLFKIILFYFYLFVICLSLAACSLSTRTTVTKIIKNNPNKFILVGVDSNNNFIWDIRVHFNKN